MTISIAVLLGLSVMEFASDARAFRLGGGPLMEGGGTRLECRVTNFHPTRTPTVTVALHSTVSFVSTTCSSLGQYQNCIESFNGGEGPNETRFCEVEVTGVGAAFVRGVLCVVSDTTHDFNCVPLTRRP